MERDRQRRQPAAAVRPGAKCFGADGRPASGGSGCDVFLLDVATDDAFYREHPGAVGIHDGGFGLSDLDLYVYKRNADGTRGNFVTGAGQATLVAVGDRLLVRNRKALRTQLARAVLIRNR